jgi:hypothetical protein
MLTVSQIVRDPYGYMLSALQLQKLYVDRNVAADKLASVTAVADKRTDEWRRLVTPAVGAQYFHVPSVCVMILIACVVQELQNAVAAACSGQGVVVKW